MILDKAEENLEYKSFPIKARELEKYNKLYPNAAKIILKEFEKSSKEKLEYDRKSLEAKISLDRLSQWQGFFVSLTMVGGAIICGVCGQAVVAGTLIGVSAIGLVKAILPHKKDKEKLKI